MQNILQYMKKKNTYRVNPREITSVSWIRRRDFLTRLVKARLFATVISNWPQYFFSLTCSLAALHVLSTLRTAKMAKRRRLGPQMNKEEKCQDFSAAKALRKANNTDSSLYKEWKNCPLGLRSELPTLQN